MAKTRNRIALALALAAVLLMGAFVLLACPAGEAEAEDVASVPVSLSVEYQSTPIMCNEPIEFTCKGSGGSGSYIFRIDAIYRHVPGDPYYSFYNSVVDPQALKFTTQEAPSHAFRYRFMSSGRYRIDFHIQDNNVSPIQSLRKIVYLTIDDPRYPSIYDKSKQIIASLGLSSNASDYDKALALHDWVIDNMFYSPSPFNGFGNLPQPVDEADKYTFIDAEAALCRGYGVCEGYRSGFELLLNDVGIRTARMTGDGHAWTAAKLDGAWYQIDTTHDDVSSTSPFYPPEDVQRHFEFGISDYVKHKLTPGHPEAGIAGYKSDSLQNNWLYRSGRVSDYSNPFISDVQSKINAGQKQFELPLASQQAFWPDSYKEAIFNVVAYALEQHAWTFSDPSCSLAASYANDQLTFTVKQEQQPVKPPTNPGSGSGSSSGSGNSGTTSGSQVTGIAMYRLYNPWTLEHFYTASAKERKDCIKRGWRDENIGWYAPTAGKDVYRLYNPYTTDHHYTLNAKERDMLVKLGWRYEGVSWKSGGNVPLYRQFNPFETVGTHNYTTSYAEHASLVKMGWKDEKIAWYGVKAGG